MEMVIYDFNDAHKEVELPDKKISEIFVEVLSGDETGFVKFEDGGMVEFDASDCRCHDFHDGFYLVTGEAIQKWLSYEPTDKETNSYRRQNLFG